MKAIMKKLFAACVPLALLLPALVFAQNLVTDTRLGKNVVDRQITGESTTFAVGEKAYLWLKVEGGTGEALTVTWQVNDLTFPATLDIGGSPWRTWASKTLHIAGAWTVTVTDSAGNTLSQTTLTVQ